MQENKFEKQVREEMEEFRIRPSAAVWDEVEKELRRKKRRRVVVYWFLLAAIGLGAYGIYNLFAPNVPGSSAPITSAQKAQPKNSAAPTTDQGSVAARQPSAGSPSTSSQDGSETNHPSPENLAIQMNDGKDSPSVLNNNAAASGNRQKEEVQDGAASAKKGNNKTNQYSLYKNDVSNRKQTVSKKDLSAADKKELAETNTTRAIIAPSVVNNSVENNNNKEADKLTQREVAAKELSSDITSSITDHDLLKDSISAVNDHKDMPENLRTPPVTVSHRRIQWGIEVGVGAGNRVDKVLPSLFPTEKMLEVSNLPAYGAINGGIPAPRPLLLPSESKTSVGFKIGVQARVPVTRKINLLAGLRYSYRSDRITVGGLLDSSIVAPPGIIITNNPIGMANRAYQYQYQGPPHQTVTNSYHFIQIPVQWQFQLNKGRVMPITWEVGITPGWLIHTNAMVYDTSYYGIYYRDKDAFSRFQLHAETGFSLHLGKRSKWHWAIGPEFNFALTPLIKNAYDPRQFLLYGGLRAQFQIPGKR